MGNNTDKNKIPLNTKIVILIHIYVLLLFVIFGIPYLLNNGKAIEVITLVFIIFVWSLIIIFVYRNSGQKNKDVIYSIDMNIRELFIFLFYKKICLECGSKLRRIKEKHFIGEGNSNIGSTVYYGNEYNIKYKYKCEKCNKIYTLQEIGTQNKTH